MKFNSIYGKGPRIWVMRPFKLWSEIVKRFGPT